MADSRAQAELPTTGSAKHLPDQASEAVSLARVRGLTSLGALVGIVLPTRRPMHPGLLRCSSLMYLGYTALVALTALCSACATTSSAAPGHPAQPSAPRTVRLGESMEAELSTASDRNLKDGSAMELYELTSKAGTPIELAASSTEVPTVLTLYAPDGRLLISSRSRGDDLSARLQTLLQEKGTYLLVVSARSAEGLGKYRLRASRLAYGEPGRMSVPGEATGLLHSGDEALLARNTFVDRFTLELDRSRTIIAELESDVVDTYLIITDARGGVILAENDDARPGTTDSRIVVDLEAGQYQILATTFNPLSEGIYKLQVRGVDVVAGGELQVPGEVMGRLANTDPIRAPRGTHHHSFEFSVKEAQTVIMDMTSGDVDSYLLLYDEDGVLVQENDDRASGTTDARIIERLQAGTYRLIATSFRPGEVGIYELSARSVELADQGPLQIPSRNNWILGDTESQPRGAQGTLQDRHILEISEATTVQIDMRSESFDAFLILFTGDGTTVLAENDDASPGVTDARLIVHLSPGRYQVGATSFRPGEEGLYELELATVEANTPGAMHIGPY